jgi:hypothetical protein
VNFCYTHRDKNLKNNWIIPSIFAIIKIINVMKSFSLLITLLVLAWSSLSGQKDVYFKVNSMLGSVPFEKNKEVRNDDNQPFTISKLDYFLSHITLYHDGTQTALSDLYILVKAGQNVNHHLGKLDVTSIDSMSFVVGVDSINNHADPTLRDDSHPLSMAQSGFMHWGWSGGYRFVRMEGSNGPTLNLNYQIHSLFDNMKRTVKMNYGGKEENDKIVLDLNADFSRAMDDNDLNQTIFVHGIDREAVNLMNNFGNKVFTPASVSVSTTQAMVERLEILPTVSIEGRYTIYKPHGVQRGLCRVTDLSGRLIHSLMIDQATTEITLSQTGMYVIEWVNGSRSTHRSVVIKQ